MRSIEERILIAVLDGEDDAAKLLLRELLPNERTALRAAAVKLEALAAGASRAAVQFDGQETGA